jgi:two-component system sensor histidine kinase KdpD
MLRSSVVDHLIRESGPIDVYVISGSQDANAPVERSRWRPHRPAVRYLQSLLLVVVGTLLSASVHPLFSPANLVMIYLLAVVIAAIYLGRGPSLLAALLSVLAFDFFFVPPHLTLAVADTQYLLTFAALVVVSLVISDLTVRIREQAEAAQQRAAQTAELYALSRDLAVAANLDAILHAIVAHVSQTFSRQLVVLLPDAARSTIKPATVSPDLALNENELAVANWAFQHSQPAGRGTDTLPAADMRYLPLNTAHGVVGVLGVKAPEQEGPLTPDQRHLLEAFASQAALAVERARLAEQAQHARLLQETEKLQTALLNMISHDLRTPLVSIIGALSGLQEKDVELDAATRSGLVENAREEAERLNRLVGNLLSMTRIESGALRVTFEPADIQDVIGVALEQLEDRLPASRIVIQSPDELPLIPMDFVLIAQVLVNLLDNAIKHSAADAPIEIAAHPAGAFLEIQVRDRGLGIPREDLKRVFDKFYRVQRPDSVSGTGLGLAICKGIIEAHGGFIVAENRPGGGTIITFTLPLQEKAA